MRAHRPRLRRGGPLVLALVACGDPKEQPDAAVVTHDVPIDMAIDANPNMPATLMDTGLCVDATCSQIASGVYAYEPRWELWSDSATKQRWIMLPAGTTIDTSNMDFWQFPVGTKLWKEFTRDNVRVETRLVMRIGAGDTQQDWFYGAYVWNQAQNATTLETFGVVDANGTQHDVPSRTMCRACHENLKPSRVLGFSALQLDFDNPNSMELDLADAITQNMLSAPPASPTTPGPYFPLPTDTSGTALPALGYLQGNCAHCHNPSSMVVLNTPMNLRLVVGALSTLQATPPYTTAVNVNGNEIAGRMKIIAPGQPDQSIMTYRFESTNPAEKMPPLGTEMLDSPADTTLRTWITNCQ